MKDPPTPPTVNVAVTVVLKLALDVARTWTACPGLRVPANVVHAPPSIAYSPFVTEIGTGAVNPVTISVFDTACVDSGTFSRGVKLNVLGVASATIASKLALAALPFAAISAAALWIRVRSG